MVNRTHVGLDVHQETTAVAVLRPGALDPEHRVIATTPEAYRKLVRSLRTDDPVFCYEAGPCGFDPYRMLDMVGAHCDVIPPTLIPRRSGRKIKNDRIDARNLARLHRAGELTTVRVPSPEMEAARDLIRLREDVKAERRRAMQRLKSFLLRHGCRYPGRATGWSQPYENWLRTVRMDQSCAQEALDHMIASAQAHHAELRAFDRRIEALAVTAPLRDAVTKLRTMKGIDTLTAATIVCEIGDFMRFPRAASFMAFVGLVPAEHSSGMREHRGSITKAGNAHVRRVLVEAAWAYQHRPAVGAKLRQRQDGAPPALVAVSWRAQQRLHTKFRRVAATKPTTVAVTAVARELAGFVWAVMRERY